MSGLRRPRSEINFQPVEAMLIEVGRVTTPRVHATLRFPASIMLIATTNPCPCGYATDRKRQCKCSPLAVER